MSKREVGETTNTEQEEYEEEYASAPVLGSDVEGQLTIDVYQTEDDIIVESTIAGVEPDDIDIDATSDSVTIRGERHKNTSIQESDYFYQECFGDGWPCFADY